MSYKKTMSDSTKQELITTFIRGNILEKAPSLVEDIVRDNIDAFAASESYATGRRNATKHIEPIIPILQADDVEYPSSVKLGERKCSNPDVAGVFPLGLPF